MLEAADFGLRDGLIKSGVSLAFDRADLAVIFQRVVEIFFLGVELGDRAEQAAVVRFFGKACFVIPDQFIGNVGAFYLAVFLLENTRSLFIFQNIAVGT